MFCWMLELHCKDSSATFDEISRATIEGLKKSLVSMANYKRVEPLLDFGYSLADGQLGSPLKELASASADVASVLEDKENGNTALVELRDALAALTAADRETVVTAGAIPKMSWRQLARCNSDSMAENADLARSALAQEREAMALLDAGVEIQSNLLIY